ncbi:MAG: hypothetical protein ACXACD_22245, partial [Candidatus Thorarchaeota archaeon]
MSGEVPGLPEAGKLAGEGSAALSRAGIPTGVQKFVPGAGILPATAELATRAEEFGEGFESPSAKAARERGETPLEDPFREPVGTHEDRDIIARLIKALTAASAPEASSEEEVREMLPKAGETMGRIPAPIDVATLGAGGVLGLGPKAGKVAQAARQGWRWGNVLEVPGGAIDVAEGHPTLGALRMGLGSLGAWSDFTPRAVDEIPVPRNLDNAPVEIPAVDDLSRGMELENLGAREGLGDLQLDELEALEVRMPDETVAEVTPNASLESAASAEAMSRQAGMSSRGERFVVYDRAGNRRPLIGPEAVDYQVRPGETYGIEGPDGFRTLDDAGGVVPPVATRPKERGSIEFGRPEGEGAEIAQRQIEDIDRQLADPRLSDEVKANLAKERVGWEKRLEREQAGTQAAPEVDQVADELTPDELESMGDGMDFADEGTGRMRRPVDQAEEIVPPELEPVKAELAQVEAEFKEAVAVGDTTRMQTLANRMSKLNDEIA